MCEETLIIKVQLKQNKSVVHPLQNVPQVNFFRINFVAILCSGEVLDSEKITLKRENAGGETTPDETARSTF